MKFSAAEVVHIGVVLQLSVWGVFRRGVWITVILSPTGDVCIEYFSEPETIIGIYRKLGFRAAVSVRTTPKHREKGDPRTADAAVHYYIDICPPEVARETFHDVFNPDPEFLPGIPNVAYINVFALAVHVCKTLKIKFPHSLLDGNG
jgi:hypothetical protein